MTDHDRVRHTIHHSNYGYGTVMWVIGKYATVKWDVGGTSMEPVENLEIVETKRHG